MFLHFYLKELPLNYKGITSHLLLLFFLTLPAIFYTQTTVEGNARTNVGQQVVAYRYADYFSWQKIKIGSTKIDGNGRFTLDLPLEQSGIIVFTINRVHSEIFIEFNQTNVVTINKVPDNSPRTFAKTIAPITSDQQVTQSLQEFDAAYEDFVHESSYTLKLKLASGKAFQQANEERLKGIQVKNIAPSDSSIVNEIVSYGEQFSAFESEVFQKHQPLMDAHPYFNEYVRYSLANLAMVVRSRELLYEQYLSATVNYNNPAVVAFIQSFYSKILETEVGAKTLLSVLNKERNYETWDSIATKIPTLAIDELRQVVLVNALYQAYNTKKANQDMALTLLVRKAKTEDTYASLIAKNYVNKIIQYKKGVEVAPFKILDKKDNIVQMEDLQGKYLYINFFASWCTSCAGEMFIINNLKKKYGKEINFVSINMDDNHSDYRTFLSKHRQFDWPILYGPSEEEILTIFNLQNIPTYVFIDSEGNWITTSAKSPSEGIANDFDLIMRKSYQAPTRYKVWDE